MRVAWGSIPPAFLHFIEVNDIKLTEEELEVLRNETGQHDLSVAFASTFDTITDINDKSQRRLVVNEMIKAMNQIINGESEEILDLDDDTPTMNIDEFLKTK